MSRLLLRLSPLAIATSLVMTTGLQAQFTVEVTHAAVRDVFIDGNRELFSAIPQLLPLADGGVAVSQPAERTILTYDRFGKADTRFGTAGAGPGEFRTLGALSSSGSSIVAVDPALRRLTTLDAQGVLLSTRPFTMRLSQGSSNERGGADARLSVPISTFPDGSTLRLAFQIQGMPSPAGVSSDPGRNTLVVTDRSGRLQRVVAIVPTSLGPECTQAWSAGRMGGGFAVPFCSGPLVSYADNGAYTSVLQPIAHASGRPTIRLTLIASSGDTAFSQLISRPSIQVSRRESDSALAALRSRRIGPQRAELPPPALAAIASMKIPTFKPLARRLLLARDGSVAIELEDGSRDHLWVVYTASGIESARFVLPRESRLQAILDGWFWSINEDTDGGEHVVRYSLVRR